MEISKSLNNTKSLEDVIKSLHPLQIIDVRPKVHTFGFFINYEYTTNKNNKRIGKKLFLFDKCYDKEYIRKEFFNWIERYNKEHPYRSISNVKFLEYTCAGVII